MKKTITEEENSPKDQSISTPEIKLSKRSSTLGSYKKQSTLEGIVEEDIEDCFYGKTFLSKEGEISARPLLEKNIICLYFSAYWCPPCRNFTPFLAEFYHEIKKNHSDFEIIFVSRDKDQNQFEKYYKTMPWLAIPFRDPRINIFQQHFNIKGIPTLVVLGKNGEKICFDGRSEVILYDYAAYNRWMSVNLSVVKEVEEDEMDD